MLFLNKTTFLQLFNITRTLGYKKIWPINNNMHIQLLSIKGNQPLVLQSFCNHDWIQKETRKEYVVSKEELQRAVNDDKVYLIDVREPFEVEKGRVLSKRYVNIPVGTIYATMKMSSEDFEKKFRVPKPNKEDKDIVFMCMGGIRSTWAFQVAQHFGYSGSKHFLGGWQKWKSENSDVK